MSRTDKDMPHWVTAEWYEPWHNCGWRKKPKYVETNIPLYWDKSRFEKKFVGYRWEYIGDCDLPETPVRTPNRYGRRKGFDSRCLWDTSWPAERYYQTRGRRCKKEWRRFEFNGPQRAAERDAARRVIQGEWETEFPDGRTRHSVLWDMWG